MAVGLAAVARSFGAEKYLAQVVDNEVRDGRPARGLNPEEQDRQRALDRSWAAAQEALDDSEFRARLQASIDRVNRSDARPMSGEEFLAHTDPAPE
ncbi:MAG: hypothetical protein M3P85_07690 [Actinomycetota bacterium]|nr:hypothetical protein [Actinomycetota bacterium]